MCGEHACSLSLLAMLASISFHQDKHAFEIVEMQQLGVYEIKCREPDVMKVVNLRSWLPRLVVCVDMGELRDVEPLLLQR